MRCTCALMVLTNTLDTQPLVETLAAVHEAAPGLPVGVTTTAWALSDTPELG